MGKIKYGIVGCGLIGNFHAQALAAIPDAELIGAYDSVPASVKNFGNKYGAAAYGSYAELLKSGVDAVCLCTPSGLHCPQALEAAAAGVNIVVEKPMAITVAEAESIIGACEKYGVVLTVISQLRFTEAVKKVKAAVMESKLGRMVVASVQMKYYRSPEYYGQSGWRGTWAFDGGGALMNQGIHGIDLLQYIAGPVKSVYGITRTLSRGIEVEDTAVAALEFKSGAIGVIEATTSVYPGYSRILSFSGDKGTIILEEDRIKEWSVENEQAPPGAVTPDEAKMQSFNDPAAICLDYHIGQLADMTHAIKTGGRPSVDQYEGIKAVRIIRAVYESSESGAPVYL